MERSRPEEIVSALCLAALAGFVDALAFTSLGGFFASFMSGNTTRLGVGLAEGVAGDAMQAAALILSFLSGVVGASVLAHRFASHARAAVMALVTLLLAVGAALAGQGLFGFALMLLAGAMGAENGVFARDGQVSIGLTYMTGTLVRLGQRLADALMGAGPGLIWLPHLFLWAAFAGGVFLGARSYLAVGAPAFWYAVVGAAAMTVLFAIRGRRFGEARKAAPEREPAVEPREP